MSDNVLITLFKNSLLGKHTGAPAPTTLPEPPITLRQVKKDAKLVRGYTKRIKTLVRLLSDSEEWVDRKRFDTIHKFDSSVLSGIQSAEFTETPSKVMLPEVQQALHMALIRAINGTDEIAKLFELYKSFSGADDTQGYDDSFIKLQAYLLGISQVVSLDDLRSPDPDAVDGEDTVLDWMDMVTDMRPTSLYGGLKQLINDKYTTLEVSGGTSTKDTLMAIVSPPVLNSLSNKYITFSGTTATLLSYKEEHKSTVNSELIHTSRRIVELSESMSALMVDLFEMYDRWDRIKNGLTTFLNT